MSASSSSSILRVLEETVPGIIETDGPQVLRVTGGAITQSVEFDQDVELRADRGKGAPTLVSGSVGGPIEINLSHGTFDNLIEALFANTTNYVGVGNTLVIADAVFSSGEITSAGASFPALEINQWFKMSGTADNNEIFKTSGTVAPTTTTITLDTTVRSAVVEAEVSCSISSGRLKQGSDPLRTFTYERELSDVSKFFTNKECYSSALSLGYNIGAPVTGTISIVAAAIEETGSVSKFPGISSEVPATVTPRYNTVTGTHVLVDNADLGESCMSSFSLEITGNLRERRCLGGGIAASGFAADPFMVTGSSSIFYGSDKSAELYDKKLEGVQILFSICIEDSEGNGFAVTLPTATITEGAVDGAGVGTDVMMSVKFEGSSVPGQPVVIIDVLGALA